MISLIKIVQKSFKSSAHDRKVFGVSLGPTGLHGVLLDHSVMVRHVPVVVHLRQVDRFAGHVKVVEVLRTEVRGLIMTSVLKLTTRSVNLSCPLMCA